MLAFYPERRDELVRKMVSAHRDEDFRMSANAQSDRISGGVGDAPGSSRERLVMITRDRAVREKCCKREYGMIWFGRRGFLKNTLAPACAVEPSGVRANKDVSYRCDPQYAAI